MMRSASFTTNDVASLWKARRPLRFWPAQRKRTARRVRYIYRRGTIHPPMHLAIKRAIDVVGAGLALIFLAPLLIAVAIAIKVTSRGPVLFSQHRYGYRNRRFRIYKFRTMYTHLGDARGTRQTTSNDPRVTPLGRVLRSTSLDELPQLFNVLRGDMSLVGPRPHVPGMLAASRLYEKLIPYYFQRHAMRPGITGLAQMNGYRGSTAQADLAIGRIDLDLEYIETWSLWLDAKIILQTIKREFLSGSGE